MVFCVVGVQGGLVVFCVVGVQGGLVVFCVVGVQGGLHCGILCGRCAGRPPLWYSVW